MMADIEVITHDGDVIKVKGVNRAYVNKGALYLYFDTEKKREVPESALWGFFKSVNVIDESTTTTTAIFARDKWKYFRLVAAEKEPAAEAAPVEDQ